LQGALFDPRAVHAVRPQLVELVEALLVQCRKEHDRAVSGGEHEPVKALPELGEIECRDEVGEAETLAGVTLPPAAAHLDHRAPDRVSTPCEVRGAHATTAAMPAASRPSSRRMWS